MGEKLTHVLNKIRRVGGDSRKLIFEPPASEKEIAELEKEMNLEIPPDFKNILLKTSAHCELKWFLPREFELPKEFKDIFSGELHWGLNFIKSFNEAKDGWVKEVFPDPNNDYDKVWHNKFVFQEVGNGDYLGIELEKVNYGKIIYLSHDDGEGHGYTMANSFNELLENWIEIGCVGAEDWQWIPFTSDKESGIDSNSVHANTWKRLIGLE